MTANVLPLPKSQPLYSKLQREVELLRKGMETLDPHSASDNDRWAFALYQKLIARRERMLSILSQHKDPSYPLTAPRPRVSSNLATG